MKKILFWLTCLLILAAIIIGFIKLMNYYEAKFIRDAAHDETTTSVTYYC